MQSSRSKSYCQYLKMRRSRQSRFSVRIAHSSKSARGLAHSKSFSKSALAFWSAGAACPERFDARTTKKPLPGQGRFPIVRGICTVLVRAGQLDLPARTHRNDNNQFAGGTV